MGTREKCHLVENGLLGGCLFRSSIEYFLTRLL